MSKYAKDLRQKVQKQLKTRVIAFRIDEASAKVIEEHGMKANAFAYYIFKQEVEKFKEKK